MSIFDMLGLCGMTLSDLWPPTWLQVQWASAHQTAKPGDWRLNTSSVVCSTFKPHPTQVKNIKVLVLTGTAQNQAMIY